MLASAPKSPLLDVSGLDRLGVIQAVQGKAPGLIYHQIGAHGPAFTGPISLSDGDIAIISDTGKVVEINSQNPAASEPAAGQAQSWSWSHFWHDSRGGGLAVVIVVVGILLLLIRAAFVRKRRRRG